MVIDVHTHIFPPEIVGARGRFFAGEPEFRLLYDSPKAHLATAESLLAVMDRDGVDHSVVFGFPWRDGEITRRHNDYVLEMAARHAPRLIPLGCVNPQAPFSQSEAERCLSQGMRGLGELAIYDRCDPRAALQSLKRLAACCRSSPGALLLIHANEPVGHVYPGKAPLGLDFYYDLARQTHDVPLILAHWGGGLCFYELLRKEAPEILGRVYYDTAASPYLYRPEVYAHIVRILGKERVLFGSDYPLLPPRRYFEEMAGAELSPEEREALQGGNAARLFGLKE